MLEFDEKFYQAHYQIGVINAKMGDRIGAIDHYQQALSINSNFYKGWYAMGLSKKAKNDNEGALVAFNEAVDVHPAYANAFCSMCEI